MSKIEQLEYRTYSEELLSMQHAFISEVTKDWKGWSYPSLKDLKEVYARDGFTPDTRHYAFIDDEMVGFVSSAVERIIDGVQTGSIQVPFIKDNDPEVAEFLMEKAISVLKEKGVSVCQKR